MNTPTIYTATPADLSPPVQTDSFCVDLVLATEYQKLKDEFKQLAAEIVALKQFPEQIVKFISRLGTSEIGSDTKETIGLAASRIKTPATDAYAASLRAEGVEMFAKHIFTIAGKLEIHDQYGADFCRDEAESFAAQLRSKSEVQS